MTTVPIEDLTHELVLYEIADYAESDLIAFTGKCDHDGHGIRLTAPVCFSVVIIRHLSNFLEAVTDLFMASLVLRWDNAAAYPARDVEFGKVDNQ